MSRDSSTVAPQTPRSAAQGEPESTPESVRPSPPGDRWTVGELLAWTTTRFEQAGIDTPRVDAEHLLAHALKCNRLDLYLRHDQLLDAAARAPFRELVRRRLAHEPVAHLRGLRGFHAIDLELSVDRRALVPRPETEHLVDWLLEELSVEEGQSVLDVGTGSGAIALAVKRARSDTKVFATDVSSDALELATTNAQRLGLDVTFLQADLVASLTDMGIVPEQGFAAVAANLPYVAHGELERLPPEVRDYEPRLALDGGLDGLDLIRRLAEDLVHGPVLRSSGRLYLEVGYDQGVAVVALLRAAGWSNVETRADLAGIPRIVAASRP